MSKDFISELTKKYGKGVLITADKVLDKVKKLNKINIDLSKQANYASSFTENWIKFYDWKDYIPLKGRPGQKVSEEDEQLSFDTFANRFGKHGKELQDAEGAFGGRFSDGWR